MSARKIFDIAMVERTGIGLACTGVGQCIRARVNCMTAILNLAAEPARKALR